MSTTVRGEHTLRVCENRILGTIYEPKRERETGGWRRLQNEELHTFLFRFTKYH
jgi:hypothetical protein